MRKKSVANWLIISIHSLRMEGDRPFLPDLHILIIFQSTPSAWRETSEHRCSSAVAPISIHSLRMEGDMPLHRAFMILLTFQSTPSAWRETLLIASAIHCTQSFQSTPSAWRETSEHRCSSAVAPISIHSLRMEGDMPLHRAFMILLTFQSTPSAWRETETTLSRQGGLLFQSTPSAWRETNKNIKYTLQKLFQSTPSAWRETQSIR